MSAIENRKQTIEEYKAMKTVVDMARHWKTNWVDTEDIFEMQSGCLCNVCQLIRAVEEYERTQRC